jgi:hypothetical protein
MNIPIPVFWPWENKVAARYDCGMRFINFFKRTGKILRKLSDFLLKKSNDSCFPCHPQHALQQGITEFFGIFVLP